MNGIFTVIGQEGQARLGRLLLPHGEVQTPVFMPVGTTGSVKAIDPALVEQWGFRLMLANTYHLYLRPGKEVIERMGGLHRLTGWSHNILTDSGGFQVFSLARLRKLQEDGVWFQSHIDGSRHFFSPEGVVEFQALLGSDVQMVLDVCSAYGSEHKQLASALDLTINWAQRAMRRWLQLREESSYRGLLFPIMQGGFLPELRARSSAALAQLDAPGLAVGGLSVGEPAAVFKEFLTLSCELLRRDCGSNRPLYVMGIGTPDYILAAIEAGVDMFDCVYPTRVARNGAALSRYGLLLLKQERYRLDSRPLAEDCLCPTCRRYSRCYLRHLIKAGEILAPLLLTQHNLFFLAQLLADSRQAIAAGRFAAFKRDFLADYGTGRVAFTLE